MNTLHRFADWYLSLSPAHAAILGMLFFFAVFIAFGMLDSYFEPNRREVRMIRRRRRKERKLIAETQAMLLARHHPSADRECFQDVKGVTR